MMASVLRAEVVSRAPVTPNVPAIVVLPDAATTLNLFVLILKLPATFNTPAKLYGLVSDAALPKVPFVTCAASTVTPNGPPGRA